MRLIKVNDEHGKVIFFEFWKAICSHLFVIHAFFFKYFSLHLRRKRSHSCYERVWVVLDLKEFFNICKPENIQHQASRHVHRPQFGRHLRVCLILNWNLISFGFQETLLYVKINCWFEAIVACLHALIHNCARAKKILLTALSLVRPHICTDPPMEKEFFQSCCWTKSPSAGKLPGSCCWADHQVLARHWGLLLQLAAAHTAKMYRTAGSPFLPSFPKLKTTVFLMSL